MKPNNVQELKLSDVIKNKEELKFWKKLLSDDEAILFWKGIGVNPEIAYSIISKICSAYQNKNLRVCQALKLLERIAEIPVYSLYRAVQAISEYIQNLNLYIPDSIIESIIDDLEDLSEEKLIETSYVFYYDIQDLHNIKIKNYEISETDKILSSNIKTYKNFKYYISGHNHPYAPRKLDAPFNLAKSGSYLSLSGNDILFIFEKAKLYKIDFWIEIIFAMFRRNLSIDTEFETLDYGIKAILEQSINYNFIIFAQIVPVSLFVYPEYYINALKEFSFAINLLEE